MHKNAGYGVKLFALFEALVESKIVQPTFIVGYPIEVSPLSKRDEKDKDLAARVQLQPRSPFSQSAMDADAETIRDAYRAIGRSDAQVFQFLHRLGATERADGLRLTADLRLAASVSFQLAT